MKPLMLTASNFRSYPELEVPMSGIQLATLCGENGAGKSSVLKAMLFGLFGAEPGLSADDYIRRGEEETRVEFSFGLNGNAYRVKRARKFNGKTGKTTLELAKKNGSEVWKAITGDTIAQTQERINETLCLDQDGFLKSAWISQGDADAFTRAKPTERKAVLAGILDLAIYSRLQDRAKKRLRTIEDELEQLRGKLELVESQLANKAMNKAYLSEAEQMARTYQYGVEGLEKKLEALRAEEKRLDAIKIKRDAVAQEYATAEPAIHQIGDKIRPLEEQIASLTTLSQQIDQLNASVENREKAYADVARLDKDLEKYNEVERQRDDLRSQYREAKAVADGIEKSLDDLFDQLMEKADAVFDVKARLATAIDSEAPCCPSCERPFADDINAMEKVQAGIRQELAAARETRDDLNQRAGKAQDQYAAACAPLADLKAQSDALPVVEYNRDRHDQARQEIKDSEGAETKLAEARGAGQRLEEINQQLAELRQEKETAIQKRQALGETLEGFKADLDQLSETNTAISATTSQLSGTRKSYESATADVTRYQAEHDRLTKLESESADDRKRQDELHATAATWRYLVEAFGKDGIPALIIDAAIPEVEDIANDILTRLGTGLEVKLETQKALKSSDGIRETLDVKIIEDGFDRPYETYSGGEAYRVNVALRVALSKLLARRAGAHIETLILDEPEGLDEEGRAKLVELLQILSETFSTILLISHHEDLREVFPARIECSKGPDGSTAEVVMA